MSLLASPQVNIVDQKHVYFICVPTQGKQKRSAASSQINVVLSSNSTLGRRTCNFLSFITAHVGLGSVIVS